MEKLDIKDKSAFIRMLLDKSLEEELLTYVCSLIKANRNTLWKAAELAGVSLRTIMLEVKKRGIDIYNEEAFREDLEFAFEN